MLTRYKIDSGKLIPSEEELCSVLVYSSPDESERMELVDKYQIGTHNLNSALDPDEIGRLEFDDGHLALIMKRPVNYSSQEVEAIRGLRSDRIAETLGHEYGAEVVHRDNLVVL
jgi:hypothetical protein